MDAILLVLRTGMQWNALKCDRDPHLLVRAPALSGVGAGPMFHEIWRQGLQKDDEQVGIDWAWLSCDGATGKAPFGGEATGPNPTDRARGR